MHCIKRLKDQNHMVISIYKKKHLRNFNIPSDEVTKETTLKR